MTVLLIVGAVFVAIVFLCALASAKEGNGRRRERWYDGLIEALSDIDFGDFGGGDCGGDGGCD